MMERMVVLQAIDSHWQEYLRAMDGLRQGVGLRAYGQRDPLVEYKNEAYQMFQQLMSDIKTEIINGAFRSATSVGTLRRVFAGIADADGARDAVRGCLPGRPGHPCRKVLIPP
jgi:preprotein translocase subunit SecA